MKKIDYQKKWFLWFVGLGFMDIMANGLFPEIFSPIGKELVVVLAFILVFFSALTDFRTLLIEKTRR